MKKTSILMALTAFLMALPISARASVIFVDDDGVQCPGALTTIQLGVTAAAPGDTVQVCPGTYAGGVVVDKAGLKLKAQGPLGAVKVAGPGTGVPLFGFTITADDVRIEGFEIYGFSGAHDASGIFVGGLFAGDTAHPADGARIEHNNIHNNGNGIYLWQSNNNRIRHNEIYNSIDIDYTMGTAILSFNGYGDAQTTTANLAGRSGKNNDISHNVVHDNDRLGIFAGACTFPWCGGVGPTPVNADISGTKIEHNDAYGNGAHGTEAIGLLNAHGGTIAHNKVHDNVYIGVYVNFSDGATVDHNDVNTNNWYGILVGDSSGITVSHNDTDEQLYGEFVYSTVGSSFDHNSAEDNSVYDLYWDGSGANAFSKNKCGTALPSKAAWDCK